MKMISGICENVTKLQFEYTLKNNVSVK